MQPTPSFLDSILLGFGDKLYGNPAAILVVVAAFFFAIVVILKYFKDSRPRIDMSHHWERPPIDEQPQQRGLPPGRDYVQWETKKDKERDDRPWN